MIPPEKRMQTNSSAKKNQASIATTVPASSPDSVGSAAANDGSQSSSNQPHINLTLETTYPPNVQSDYGGNIFQHQYSRLRQLPVYNTEGDLVPTHKIWKELHPRTLVTLNADLICWIYDNDDKPQKVLSFLCFRLA